MPGFAESECDMTDKLPHNDTILLSIFLKHDKSMNNDERDVILDKTGFKKNFPPEGVEVVNHYVLMGIGQLFVLRLPPELLRTVNRAIEHTAWGAFDTEFYITYDLAEAKRFAESQK
jgi:hypothetical protein